MQRAFPESMVTPGERIEQPDVPERPHKRRKQPKDLYRTLNDDKLRRNLLTAMDTLRDRVRASSKKIQRFQQKKLTELAIKVFVLMVPFW